MGIPHKFDHGEERSIIAFAKTPEVQQEASDAGAGLSGGVELIKQIQNGEVSLQNFQFVVAHPEILPELVALRGLLKRRFPSARLGTLEVSLGETVDKFLNGVSYSAVKDEYEKDFGIVDTVIGTVSTYFFFWANKLLNILVKYGGETFGRKFRGSCQGYL